MDSSKVMVSVCVLVVGLLAGTAMATPAFTLPAQIDIEPGESVAVVVGATGLASLPGGGASGVNLYLGTSVPFTLSDLIMYTPPGSYAEILQISEQVVYGTTTAYAGVISDGPIARVVITCPAGTPIGTQSFLTTDLSYYPELGVMSDFFVPAD